MLSLSCRIHTLLPTPPGLTLESPYLSARLRPLSLRLATSCLDASTGSQPQALSMVGYHLQPALSVP